MRRRIVQRCAVLVLLAAAIPAIGETHEVAVTGLTFAPQDLVIDVGDSVHWTWASDPMTHNVESGVDGIHDGRFRSGDPAITGDFTVVFDEAFLVANPALDNLYRYYCAIHVLSDMVGSVTVSDPIIPTVSQWGLVVMVVLLLGAGTVVYRRRVAIGQA